MKFRTALLAASTLTLPVAAHAQNFMGVPFTGLYVGAGAGVNIMQDQDAQFRVFQPPIAFSGKPQMSVGPAFNVYAGGSIYGFRVELEGAYRYNTFRNGTSGQEQKFGPMVNVLYDLTGYVPYVAPYVGVGFGLGCVVPPQRG